MPTFTEVYKCLLAHGPGYAQGPRGGEYTFMLTKSTEHQQ